MFTRFAAAFRPASIIAGCAGPAGERLTEAMAARAANDNRAPLRPLPGPLAGSPGFVPTEPLLHAALAHFARHGLGAAQAARAKAECALAGGDSEAFGWWLGITRTLDPRLAREVERAAPEVSDPAAGPRPRGGGAARPGPSRPARR